MRRAASAVAEEGRRAAGGGGGSYLLVAARAILGVRWVTSPPLQPTASTPLVLVRGTTAVQAVRPYTEESSKELQQGGLWQIVPGKPLAEWLVADNMSTLQRVALLGLSLKDAHALLMSIVKQQKHILEVKAVKVLEVKC